ncbi:kyphoscoliosis peptidase [Dunckerocampus dactyliophorus]|uniref:kyphoscoliosis peptidase n=1 Tax=Dunckerocampus dactyliophorus TaxID=161453 RepID=UPI002404FA1B|nr:kyphoscoliosis peptidase [Dunckerocampus dactyliophorus]
MSAEVGIHKFSFPFSCAARLSKQDEESQVGCIQVKALELRDLEENPILSQSSAVTLVGALEGHENPKAPAEGDVATTQVLVSPEASQSAVLSRRSVFEKLAAEAEDQRPVAKRQLSSESAARNITVVKKSAVRAEAEEQRHQQTKASMAVGRRRRRKDLFASSELFHRLDSHVIRAGAELKEKRVHDVATIVQSITKVSRTELEKVRAIWVWLCHNIEYDVSGFLGHSERMTSPEEVIATGRGVCCGYSSLCTDMCRLVGIECQEVAGHSKGIGYRQGQSFKNVKSDHLWNAVLLGGQWFLMDACWGAGQVNMKQESFVKRFDDFYFLTDPEEFIESHFPDEEKWQLLESPITLEEFERRVFKTSSFFSMGLRLMQPHHCHMVTDDGEANVSIGFSRPVTFTYEMKQDQDFLHCGASEQQESSHCSSGLLKVSHRSMNLQLLPPASGIYDLKIFARPETATTPLGWVCSFTVECPEPRAMEDIPENPYLSWGLLPNAASLGVAGCSQDSQVAEVEEGRFELVLKTSRPLMVLCELVHPHLHAAVTKRCLATQIQPDLLTCHVLCPSRGFYRLSVFVRDYEKTDVKFQTAANILLHCKGKVISQDDLFPPNLSSACGPGTRTSEMGLSKFSHTTPVVSTPQGKCNITFHNQRDLELHPVISRADNKAAAFPLTRHLFCTYTDSKVTVSVSLPDTGMYRLGLYARTSSSGDFDPMCDFVLRNSCDQAGLPFPCVYAAWRKGCVLFEPRVGLLESATWVRFRVRIPGAQRVCVVGEGRTDLKLNKSRVWEGEVFSGEGVPQLKLAASSGDSSDLSVFMTFDIKPVQGGV